MPKSAKKRKDKAADFAKAKLKLGKEKKAPSNVIDTSFKARSIALPTQSITVTREEGAPTTKRNLTIDNLLAHLKHYSPAVKKDALHGLVELLETYWTLVDKNLSQLINQLARVIGDEDAGVRKQLLSLFSWLLPRIPKEDLIPHAPTLCLFTASAQTHIFPEIRIDAVRFLSLFLEHIPEPFVEGWTSTRPSHGKRILEGYLGNLNPGTQHRVSEGLATATLQSGVTLSPSSKLAVMQSFSTFLRAGLSISVPSVIPGDRGGPLCAWFMSQSFKTRDAFREYENVLTPRFTGGNHLVQCAYNSSDSDECAQNYPLANVVASWTIQELEDVVASSKRPLEGGSVEESALEFLSHLSQTLHPLLVSTILDNAPLVFSPDSKASETETLMLVAVSQIASLLYGAILRSPEAAPASLLSGLETLLSYMTPYFPFTSSKSRDMKLSQSFQDLNLIYCELTSLLVLCSKPASVKPGRQSKPSSTLMTQTSGVSDYITELLRGKDTSNCQIPQSLAAGAYLALLPSVWAIISNSYSELSSHSIDLLQALLDHAIKTSSKSSAKRLTVEFVARLVLLETDIHHQSTFRIRKSDQAQQSFESWLIHLPQVLWETGNNDTLTTEVILRFLLRALHCRSPLVSLKVITALVLRLVPYFAATHPVRGLVRGPYCRISLIQLRRLCLDVVATLLARGGSTSTDVSEANDSLLKAVDLVVANTVEEEYWTHVYKAVSSSFAI